MKRVILIAAILVIAVSAFGQGPGMNKFGYHWGTCQSYYEVANPYTATGYIYDPSTYSWVCGTSTGTDLITITCDIEMYMSMNLEGSDVYFHIADDRQYMEALINGSLSSNNGQHLFVSDDLGNKDLDQLEYVVDEFGRDIAYMNSKGYDTTIPVEWYLKEPLDPAYRPGQWSEGGNNGQLHGYQWLLSNGDPCTHPFIIKIVIRPGFHQPDGRYEMDPLVTCAPVL